MALGRSDIMRGTNSEVVRTFFNHTPLSSHDGNLKTTPNTLINYSTIIAYYENNTYYINISKYSRTTSKIQTLIKRYLQDNLIENYTEYMAN